MTNKPDFIMGAQDCSLLNADLKTVKAVLPEFSNRQIRWYMASRPLVSVINACRRELFNRLEVGDEVIVASIAPIQLTATIERFTKDGRYAVLSGWNGRYSWRDVYIKDEMLQ